MVVVPDTEPVPFPLKVVAKAYEGKVPCPVSVMVDCGTLISLDFTTIVPLYTCAKSGLNCIDKLQVSPGKIDVQVFAVTEKGAAVVAELIVSAVTPVFDIVKEFVLDPNAGICPKL